MITDIADYFAKGCGRCERFETPDCSTQRWNAGLARLREICLRSGLEETVKWGHPCYRHADRNLAIIGAFRGDFRLSFFNPSLMKDPEGVLEKQGPNTQHADMIRFTDNDRVSELEPIIAAYLHEAKGYAEDGIKPAVTPMAIEMPAELADAMACDPELAEAFRELTPGRQRSYLINLNGAKQSKTRVVRIGRFRDRILAGKGATER